MQTMSTKTKLTQQRRKSSVVNSSRSVGDNSYWLCRTNARTMVLYCCWRMYEVGWSNSHQKHFFRLVRERTQKNVCYIWPSIGFSFRQWKPIDIGTFRQFLCANGVAQKTTAPYHPSLNGQAERFVQTVKKSLAAMREDGGKLDIKFCRLLMQLRKIPSTTGSNAYHLMYGWKIRTHLSLMHPKIDQETTTTKEVKRHFDIGDRVQARD